jgi:putative ABC transport system permease protein
MLVNDLRYAARTLRNHPGFALTAILTLALGIGASTAIFSVVNAVLLRPLPYGDAGRLALITEDLRVRHVVDFPMAPGDVPDIRAAATLFDGIAAVQPLTGITMKVDPAPPQAVTLALVTTNIFDVLKVPVMLGRNFSADDGTPNKPVEFGPDAPAAPPPARLPAIGILGYDFWQRQFGGDTAIIGKTVTLLGGQVHIVGVASPRAELLFPPSMNVPRYPDVWMSLRLDFDGASRQNVAYRLIGRLGRGATVGAARAQIEGVGADLRRRFPVRNTSGVFFRLEPMKQYLVAGVRTALLALMGAVTFVLLIACANVANLLLVRASQRERELAVRAALGGSSWTIIRQLLAESLALAAAAAVIGIGLAELGIRLLLALAPANLPRLADVSVDPTVLAFSLVVSAVAAIVFGVAPALRASRPDIAQVLRAAGRTPSLSGAARLRTVVIVAEVALSFVLLVGSGLMVRSFIALTRVDLGFDAGHMLSFGLANVQVQLRSPNEADAFIHQMHDALAAVPGAVAVTAALPLPLDGSDPSGRWGPMKAADDQTLFRQGGYISVAPGYFTAMKTRVIAGREFTSADRPTDKTIVIDDWAAKVAFGTQPAVGRSVLVRRGGDDVEQYTVIGVVAHQRHLTLTGDEKEVIYFPAAWVGLAGEWAVRTAGDPAALAPAVRRAVASVNSRLLITGLEPMAARVSKAESATRFALILIGIFASIAALLAAVGLYGVLSSVVRQRTSEIGIRMAFGAQASSIFGLVIGEGLKLSAVGVAIGLAGALAATRVMVSMLVGVQPTDPITFASMVAVFLTIAALACWLPARRAARLDPNAALREE